MTLQAGSAIPGTVTELVLNSSLPTKIVVAILALLSLFSWAIMLAKWIEFRRVERSSDAFLDDFSHVTKLDQAGALARRSKPGPYARVTARAVAFVHEITPLAVDGGKPDGATLSAAQVEALHLVLDSEFTAERDRLGRSVPSLAVIGSASPLLGLFGTMLGVISAFLGIAQKGSGNLGAVAPGVAEALTATAAALAVAVPAIFAYNVFAARLNRFDGRMDGFGAELIALLAREGRI